MISIHNLTKYYKNNARGIIDVSLDIKPGEVFGFIGPNGAGKSTTVRTLLNFLFPTSGTATLMDLDIILNSVEIRKHVGYIPGEINYYSDMKVKAFLVYSAKYFEKDYQERLDYLSTRLDLDLTRRIGDLSLGNRKKVAIIQAFIHEPEILILDEATSGLDPLMQTVFFELLEEERKRGATIFYSSHVLSEVQNICDRVGIIREGQLIKIEKVEDIIKTQAKNVRFTSTKDINLSDSNIIDMKKKGNIYTFTYTGKSSSLLKLLVDMDVDDVRITEPSLEEIFMHFYQKEEN